MKKGIFYCTAFACMFTSCLDKEKFTESPDIDNGKKEELDLSFDFSMKSTKELTITVEAPTDADKAKVPFYVYLDNPYTEEGDHRTDLLPVFSGATNENGILKTKITVPNIATQLYIYTPYSTYESMQTCEIQNDIAVTFTSIYMAKNKTVRARSGEQVFTGTRERKVINPTTYIYSYYNFNFNSNMASFGMISDGRSTDAEIVEIGSSATLTSNEQSWANTYFPEKKTVNDEKYFSSDYCTDLEVKRPSDINGTFKGAHVWVTFIGDGGFSIKNETVINSLCYYTYTGTLTSSDAAKLPKTIIYPSTNTQKLRKNSPLVIGSRVQLLYWDGEKYVDTFPEGVKIGWAMVSNGKMDLKHLGNIGNFRFSTPILNSEIGEYPGCYANGIGRWCKEAQMNIVGMENRQHRDPDTLNDMDYNDILFKVTSDPVIKPIDEVPPVDPDEVSRSITGTLAFEDNWPQKGDYDFNDFVTDYTYSLVKNKGSEYVKAIRLTFTPRALGAVYNSGFAIQLPVNADNVEKVTGGELEATNGKAVVIVYNDTRKDGFNGRGGFINTQINNDYIAGESLPVNVTLKTGITLDDFQKFNPFLYVGNRSHEIHLTDMPPTEKMDVTLLGTEEDRSNPDKEIYYRMDNTYPWALDIPSTTNSTGNVWEYPIEGAIISDAYPNYNDWTSDHDSNWFNLQKSEYIYKKISKQVLYFKQ